MENLKTIVVLLVFLIASCDPIVPASPAVSVSVAEIGEFDDGYAMFCRVTVRAENTGSIPVVRSTVSVELATDKASYFRTFYDDRGIPPATSIFFSVEFELLSIDEIINKDSVKVHDWFFD